jgi:hypothetical protein
LLGCTDRNQSSADKHIDFRLHKFGDKAWEAIQLSLSVTRFNLNVFPLDITKIPQPLPECLKVERGRRRRKARYQIPYPRDFLRLLRLRHRSQSKH